MTAKTEASLDLSRLGLQSPCTKHILARPPYLPSSTAFGHSRRNVPCRHSSVQTNHETPNTVLCPPVTFGSSPLPGLTLLIASAPLGQWMSGSLYLLLSRSTTVCRCLAPGPPSRRQPRAWTRSLRIGRSCRDDDRVYKVHARPPLQLA